MNDTNRNKFLVFSFLLLAFLSIFHSRPLKAQNNQGQQVFLTFRRKGAFNRVITAYYKNERFYLPVTTLFNILGIDYTLKPENMSVQGFYLNVEDKYRLFFLDQKHYALLKGEKYKLPFNTFIVGKLDYYLISDKFNEIFGLNFSVNFNALNLELKTEKTIPVVAALKRKQQRERVRSFSFGHEDYPLLYGRTRNWFAGGFLDYTLSANITSSSNVYVYGFNAGAEVLGGGLRGQVFGSYSNDYSNMQVNNVIYRYVTDKDNPYLTQIKAGQLNTIGLNSNAILGVSFTNEPVVPRVLFDNYIIDGSTMPGAEVELYMNNALVDFQVANGLGRYHFKVPLTYGNTRIRVKIYGPGGQIIERSRRISIPFRFLPEGEVNYHITAGRLKNAGLGIIDSSMVIQGDVSAGITDWLSASLGAEYYSELTNATPVVYGALSSRLFSNYNFSAKIAPQAFYEFTGSAIYTSLVNWRLSYTYFTQQDGLYNILGKNQQARGSLFLPFSIGSLPLNFRIFASRQFRDSQDLSRYRLNLNTRINKLNLRFGYIDRQIGPFSVTPSRNSRLMTSATYNFSQRPGMPFFLKGSFVRAAATYNPFVKQFETVELNISRQIFDQGYIQLNYSHNFIGDFNVIGFNISYDFNSVRSTTSFRRIRDQFSAATVLNGSIGFDPLRGNILFENRQQVGQAGASFQLYIDENGSRKYDEGEKLITENPIRFKRSSGSFTLKDSTVYLTQLRPYKRYDVDLYLGAIQNPLLVPAIDKFSFLAEPNQYKTIDIPFFISGIISGKAVMVQDSLKQPIAGLNIIVDKQKGDFHKILRTFADGSFYSFKIPPGRYTLRVDSSQLAFLNAVSKPSQIDITVEATPRGDLVDNLYFSLTPKLPEVKKDTLNQPPAQKFKKEEAKSKTEKKSQKTNIGHYTIQVSSWKTKRKAIRLAKLWHERGFKNTFVVKFINHDLHKTWYRVRLGKFFTADQAQQLKHLFKDKYKIDLWIIKNE